MRSAGGVAGEKSSNSVVNAGVPEPLAEHHDAEHHSAVGIDPDVDVVDARLRRGGRHPQPERVDARDAGRGQPPYL